MLGSLVPDGLVFVFNITIETHEQPQMKMDHFKRAIAGTTH